MAEVKPAVETFAKIKVVGVGGSGGNAINRMIESGIKGVEFIAVNTDVQALHYNKATKKLHIGKTITRGLGAGMNSELGKQSAEEAQNEIRDILKDADMVFVTCGLGGGTGTGASPVIAELARDLGALTVAIVTKPFAFEGAQRRNIAERGMSELSDKVDTIITIPNDKLLQVIDKKTSLLDAFMVVDEVLRQGVQGISELITIPGLINVDFADVKAVMANAGSALMGIGQASGENKAIEAAKSAISSPLLEMSIEGARGVLFTIVGGPGLTMHEVNEAAKIITASVDEDAKIIFGAVVNEKLKDEIKVTVVATGFDGRQIGISESVGGKRPYTPSPFLSEEGELSESDQQEKKEKDKKRSKISSLKAAQAEPAGKKDKDSSEEDDDELGIPAFIRKKMM
ncbi:cell division protein FtsZ [Patescibacteria group bacterium]|nr:cell division protein FtsZ [Candidatus Falkowbacteria bacterium]MBU3906294.1 cell division protein FtsZ [Patescibacteria group bacterium]MCG2697919.1 cell division protein FtsZ [Candidatus Parcubacteria bacterium]MBU4015333.1 cell division protein FtsZ [Patescibacteria group bacterium]MBU4026899.1 cell division protein FtsZ [Patescibacteria group bacterium]